MSAAKKTAAAPIKPRHFTSAKAFGAWLDKNHERAPELWVTSAKHDETKARRLDRLIAECPAGRRIGD